MEYHGHVLVNHIESDLDLTDTVDLQDGRSVERELLTKKKTGSRYIRIIIKRLFKNVCSIIFRMRLLR